MVSVTAIITTYNRDIKIVERALNSILDQTYPVEEILIMDDNKVKYDTLGTFEVLDDRIKYVKLKGNHGVGYARNMGARLATSEWIAFLDDDDEWVPEKIEVQINKLSFNPDAKLISGIGKIVTETGEDLGYTWSRTIFKEHPSYIDMLIGDRVGSASHPLINREAFISLSGFKEDRDIQPAEEDYEFWIRFSKNYDIYCVNYPLYIKHMDETEHISRKWKNVCKGYINIFRKNKEAYLSNSEALERIYYNIVRAGVKGHYSKSIPYSIKWVYAKDALRRSKENTEISEETKISEEPINNENIDLSETTEVSVEEGENV